MFPFVSHGLPHYRRRQTIVPLLGECAEFSVQLTHGYTLWVEYLVLYNLRGGGDGCAYSNGDVLCEGSSSSNIIANTCVPIQGVLELTSPCISPDMRKHAPYYHDSTKEYALKRVLVSSSTTVGG